MLGAGSIPSPDNPRDRALGIPPSPDDPRDRELGIPPSPDEAHHRGQLSLYLRMLGVDPPPIFGHKAEAVGEAIKQEHARTRGKDQD